MGYVNCIYKGAGFPLVFINIESFWEHFTGYNIHASEHLFTDCFFLPFSKLEFSRIFHKYYLAISQGNQFIFFPNINLKNTCFNRLLQTFSDYYRLFWIFQTNIDNYIMFQAILGFTRLEPTILDFYRLLQTIIDNYRLLQTMADYCRLLQTIIDYYRLFQIIDLFRLL